MIDRPIMIGVSKTADTRTCDVSLVSKQQLFDSSIQHINDVRLALAFFKGYLSHAADVHDFDKLSDIESFYEDFQTKFKQTDWWDRHRQMHRHHLAQPDGVPDDVNLLDILEYIADCVMAGMGRSGSVTPLAMNSALLQQAFENTVTLLKGHVVVRPEAPARPVVDEWLRSGPTASDLTGPADL